jgi:hypothetical protein
MCALAAPLTEGLCVLPLTSIDFASARTTSRWARHRDRRPDGHGDVVAPGQRRSADGFTATSSRSVADPRKSGCGWMGMRLSGRRDGSRRRVYADRT